jgi:hypothetical protein
MAARVPRRHLVDRLFDQMVLTGDIVNLLRVGSGIFRNGVWSTMLLVIGVNLVTLVVN